LKTNYTTQTGRGDRQPKNKGVIFSALALFLFFFFLFNLTSVSSSSFGYNYLEVKTPSTMICENCTVNVNNTENLQGRDTSQLYFYFRDLMESYFNGLYCRVVGCTMQGNINMNNNDITNVNDIYATTLNVSGGKIYYNGTDNIWDFG